MFIAINRPSQENEFCKPAKIRLHLISLQNKIREQLPSQTIRLCGN